MPKLTQQEIEQERVKFEAYLIKTFPSLIDCIKNKSKFGRYYNFSTDANWIGWLARAELAKGE